MPRIRRCCCGGIGITTTFGTYRLVHPGDVGDDFIPCWALAGVLESMPPFCHVMGYDLDNDWVVFNDIITGAIQGVRIRECIDGVSPLETIISDTDANAIIATAFAEADSAPNVRTWWNCYSNGRLYGSTYYWHRDDDPETSHYRSWSVDYSGGDYTEHFHRTGETFDVDVPEQQDVIEGDVLTIEYITLPNQGQIRLNGAVVSTVDNFFGVVGSGGSTVIWTIGFVGGQYLMCRQQDGFGGGLFVADDGSDLDTSNVGFVALDPDDASEIPYFPWSMGWDARKQSLVVLWGKVLEGVSIATYIKQPITAGNIIEQDGVTLYGVASVGGGKIDPFRAPTTWNVPILFGGYPRPLEVIAGVIVPPPPVPETPDCTLLTDCVTDPPGDFIPVLIDTRFDYTLMDDLGREYTNVNTYTNLTGGTAIKVASISSPCTGTISGDLYYEITLGELTNYSDPGKLIRYRDFTDPMNIHKWEEYCWKIGYSVDCTDGVTTITGIAFFYQTFEGDVGTDWPTYIDSGCRNPSPIEATQGGVSGLCSASTMLSKFEYTVLDHDSELGFEPFGVYGTIGDF